MKNHLLALFVVLSISLLNQAQAQNQLGQSLYGEFSSDDFGNEVALNDAGNIMAVSAVGNGSYAGHVRVCQINGNSWQQMGSDIDGTAANEASGHAISLNNSGTLLAVGAPYESLTDMEFVLKLIATKQLF